MAQKPSESLFVTPAPEGPDEQAQGSEDLVTSAVERAAQDVLPPTAAKKQKQELMTLPSTPGPDNSFLTSSKLSADVMPTIETNDQDLTPIKADDPAETHHYIDGYLVFSTSDPVLPPDRSFKELINALKAL